MTESSFCPTCGTFMWFPDTHQCPPVYECWEEEDAWEEDGELKWDGLNVRAATPEHAAEKFLEEKDMYGADGPTDEAVVFVKKQGEEEITKWNVTSEPTVEYHATQIKEE